jgi:hypothetical protein
VTALIVTAVAFGSIAFLLWTDLGRSFAAWLRVTLSWLWLTRIGALGLLALLAFPVLARGAGRSLIIGVYDLHGDVWGLIGAGCAGLLLAFAIWTVFVVAALTLWYGKRRTQCIDDPPSYFPFACKALLIAALVINVWTVLAATGPNDRGNVAWALGVGLVVGFAVIWCIEEVHRRMNFFRMQRYHLMPHKSNDPRAGRPIPQSGFLNNLHLRESVQTELRGYIGTKDGRSYLFPGHGLAILATAVFALLIYLPINFFIDPASQLTALTYLLVSLITWVWVLAGATFFFDAYRIPVLLPLVAWVMVAAYFPKSDHFYRIWPAAASLEQLPATPDEVISQASSTGRKIVLVAAAGGGIQSTAWTAKVLAELERLAGEKEPGQFARSVQALSGVSGGSTGIMFFALAYGPAGFAGPRTAEPSRAYDRRLLDRIPAAAYATSLGQTTWGLAYPDLGHANFPFYLRDPFRDRAEAMESAWAFNAARKMQSAGQSLATASLREWQADTRAGLRPAVIFNSTIVETGQRICFSTAPSQQAVEGRCEFWAPPTRNPADPYAKMFLYPGADIRITTAVRLSATFPFVSPNARPGLADGRDGKRMLRASAAITPGASGKLHLADGGYYENSGLSDLAQWLDRGLTNLRNKHSQLPTEVLVIQIEPFPESETARENNQPLPPETQRIHERGTLFQIVAPIVTLNSVRGAGHTASANHDFTLLRTRWQIGSPPVAIRHVRFVLPKLKPEKKQATKGGWWWPSWAEAKPEQPPLSWHLREAEQRAVDDAWAQLFSERQGDFHPAPTDEEWEALKSRPIDKVLYFLSAKSPASNIEGVP